MIAQIFASFTRGTVSRGRSLPEAGGADLAGMAAAPGVAAAGKSGRQAKKRCRKQRGQCLAFLTEFCDGNAACVGTSPIPCCEDFARCDVAAATECILRALD